MSLLNKIKGVLYLTPITALFLMFLYIQLGSFANLITALALFAWAVGGFLLALRGIGEFFEEANHGTTQKSE